MINRVVIRDFYGHKLGTIEEDSVTGDKTIRDFYGKIRGRYYKKQNITKDFYGRIVARGDQTAALLPSWNEQRRNK